MICIRCIIDASIILYFFQIFYFQNVNKTEKSQETAKENSFFKGLLAVLLGTYAKALLEGAAKGIY